MNLPLPAAELGTLVLGVLWPFLRISAMLLAAPIFGARNVPTPVRMLLGLLLAALVAPLLPPPPDVDLLSPAGVLISAQQILIGVVMGFILQLVFSSLAQAGEAMALSMGLGFASINDPQNGLTVPIVSQYYVIVATLLFLTLGGHHVAFGILFESFELLPVGQIGLGSNSLWELVGWGARMYAFALFIALPVIVAMLLVNLSLGVVTRAAPQLNIFAVGFPFMLLVGLTAMMLTVPALSEQVERLLESAFMLMSGIL